MSKQSKILIVSGVITVFLLASGGVFWANKKDFSQPTNLSNSSSPYQKSNNDKPNNPPEQKNPPPMDNPPLPDNPQKNNYKIKLKVFWNGNPRVFIKGYDDCWNFVPKTNLKDRLLISNKFPVLVGKNLVNSKDFTLAYSENEVVKKILITGQSGQVILLESGFTLTPDTPLKDDPDFLDRNNNAEVKNVYFDYSQYTGGDYIFIDNQIQEGRDEKDLDKFVFHSDNPFIQKLLAKNHLQNQPKRADKEYIVEYLEKDIEKYNPATRTYYLNNQARVEVALAK